MVHPSRRFGGRARGMPISSGSRAGCGRDIGPWCGGPAIARQCGTAAGARRVAQVTLAAGRSLEELQKTITLDRYKSWAYYERLRAANIAAAYQNLKTYR